MLYLNDAAPIHHTVVSSSQLEDSFQKGYLQNELYKIPLITREQVKNIIRVVSEDISNP